MTHREDYKAKLMNMLLNLQVIDVKSACWAWSNQWKAGNLFEHDLVKSLMRGDTERLWNELMGAIDYSLTRRNRTQDT